ncbi:polysaccharide biosynthesis domain-containing protein [Ditylenchus destructor]|uniref:Polysaccharide biosynthesis domain-containing protein n=1 Tax=Ditylenchus destructor TaxID=166010 RepID=A0AAD4NAZ3_9BILA|nr:polysaccharide biosynthesis domain-containing protein [Ditylenchus destructor]
MADLATQLHDDPQNYVNDQNVEVAWAIKAAESASIHMNLLLAVQDTTKLRLNKHQDEIYAKFRELFRDMDVENVTEDNLKGDNKERWREFCEHFKNVDDYNLGTILRRQASGIYDEQNTLITHKIVFLAVEAARNVEGINQKWKSKFAEEHAAAHSAGDRNVI